MDRLDRYRKIVRDLVEEFASYKPSNGQIETEAIVDPVKDHYEVMNVGWEGTRRVHGSVIHIDIIGDKVWLQHNGTDRLIADEMVEAGIPRDHIVLGFHPAEHPPTHRFRRWLKRRVNRDEDIFRMGRCRRAVCPRGLRPVRRGNPSPPS